MEFISIFDIVACLEGSLVPFCGSLITIPRWGTRGAIDGVSRGPVGLPFYVLRKLHLLDVVFNYILLMMELVGIVAVAFVKAKELPQLFCLFK